MGIAVLFQGDRADLISRFVGVAPEATLLAYKVFTSLVSRLDCQLLKLS